MAMTAQPTESGTRQRARRNLVRLLGLTLHRGWTIRAAQIYGWAAMVGFAAMTWVASRGYGADSTVLALVARAAGVLAWLGAFAAFTLSSTAKDNAVRSALLALAFARGAEQSDTDKAEVVAMVRLLLGIVVLPTIALAAFVWLVVAGGETGREGWSLLGACAFGAVACIVLGVVASLCRQRGRAWGRTWFLVVVVLPWPLAELMLPPQTAELASIPGLLGLVWKTFTVGSG